MKKKNPQRYSLECISMKELDCRLLIKEVVKLSDCIVFLWRILNRYKTDFRIDANTSINQIVSKVFQKKNNTTLVSSSEGLWLKYISIRGLYCRLYIKEVIKLSNSIMLLWGICNRYKSNCMIKINASRNQIVSEVHQKKDDTT